MSEAERRRGADDSLAAGPAVPTREPVSTAHVGPDGATPAPADAIAADEAGDYTYGLELKSRSQWAYARRRFLRHRLAVASLIVLVIILGAGAFADVIAPYSYETQNFEAPSQAPVRTAPGKASR